MIFSMKLRLIDEAPCSLELILVVSLRYSMFQRRGKDSRALWFRILLVEVNEEGSLGCLGLCLWIWKVLMS